MVAPSTQHTNIHTHTHTHTHTQTHTQTTHTHTHTGTIVALEKEAGILKDEHVPIIESVRNKIEKEWKEYLQLE